MQKFYLLFVVLFLKTAAFAQVLTDSNLPIVIITTDTNPATGLPTEIPDDPKVLGSMKIIYRPDGSRNYVTDQNNTSYLNYNGRIGIELRGSSSQALPKKPYGFTTLQANNTSNNNVSLLGMPAENDWVLNALAFDPSLIRDYLSYNLSRNMGNYTTRGVYCEVIVNGDYKGLYILLEKIKINSARVDIVKMNDTDNASPNLTGGYITKADKTTGGDPVAWTMTSSGVPSAFIHEQPKPDAITVNQNDYIEQQFFDLQNKLLGNNSSLQNGYSSVIDIPSFVDFIIINELASNVDAYQFSTFFHKDRMGKLRAGPIWDFNLTYGNDLFDWGYDRSHTDVWHFYSNPNTALFWKKLYEEPTFKCYLSKRWSQLTSSGGVLNYNVIVASIDQYVALLSEAASREQTRWGSISNHLTNVQELKTWLQARINWMNTQLNNYNACANPVLPNLVISKIHYNPFASTQTSNNLEFIEITNNSFETVPLTGMYIKELGISYVFPANSVIQPQQNIYLASNSAIFQTFYGIPAFGQFTRNLSNKSYKIVLADAYGNTIDSVEYLDNAPWPASADGTGPYLKLIDINSDNSLATNWTTSTDALISCNNGISRKLAIEVNTIANWTYYAFADNPSTYVFGIEKMPSMSGGNTNNFTCEVSITEIICANQNNMYFSKSAGQEATFAAGNYFNIDVISSTKPNGKVNIRWFINQSHLTNLSQAASNFQITNSSTNLSPILYLIKSNSKIDLPFNLRPDGLGLFYASQSYPIAGFGNIYAQNYRQINGITNINKVGGGAFIRATSLPTSASQYNIPPAISQNKGTIRFNALSKTFEGYDGNNWLPLN
jgi:hypothetical protein